MQSKFCKFVYFYDLSTSMIGHLYGRILDFAIWRTVGSVSDGRSLQRGLGTLGGEASLFGSGGGTPFHPILRREAVESVSEAAQSVVLGYLFSQQPLAPGL